MVNKKCRPQLKPYHIDRHCICQCKKKFDSKRLFRDNIRDVANALVEVMQICGIHVCKADSAREIILESFVHYDEQRHRIDGLPKKTLRKEDLVFSLGKRCLMTRVEALLTYAIMKRAFKAFYHGTAESSLRNPIVEAQLIHTQACLWVHAAKRTAQIYAEYEGLLYPTQKQYEECIKCVYKDLYDRLKARASPVELPCCPCRNCAKRIVPTSTGISQRSESTDTKKCTSSSVPSKQYLEKMPRCTKCKCPRLLCVCDVDRKSGKVSLECSQGPFICRWIRVDKDAPVFDPCITKPEKHICPVDCEDLSSLSEDEGVCTCGEECDCELGDDEEIGEGLDNINGIEDQSDDDDDPAEYSYGMSTAECQAPVVNVAPVMLKDKTYCEFMKEMNALLDQPSTDKPIDKCSKRAFSTTEEETTTTTASRRTTGRDSKDRSSRSSRKSAGKRKSSASSKVAKKSLNAHEVKEATEKGQDEGKDGQDELDAAMKNDGKGKDETDAGGKGITKHENEEANAKSNESQAGKNASKVRESQADKQGNNKARESQAGKTGNTKTMETQAGKTGNTKTMESQAGKTGKDSTGDTKVTRKSGATSQKGDGTSKSRKSSNSGRKSVGSTRKSTGSGGGGRAARKLGGNAPSLCGKSFIGSIKSGYLSVKLSKLSKQQIPNKKRRQSPSSSKCKKKPCGDCKRKKRKNCARCSIIWL